MSTTIKCPNCQHEFEPNDSIREEVQKELRNKMTEWQKQQQQKLDEQLISERNKIQKEAETLLRKSIAAEFENKFNLQDQINKENEEKLKQARQQQLEFLQKEQQLKNKEAELELELQKKMNAEREKLQVDIKAQQDQKLTAIENEYKLREKQWEEKFEAQKKLADEMKRKAEQGSMQMQGEVQEIALEEMLRTAFPFDMVTEVGKGIRGADCILTVRNNFGQECGKIIFESKRTKDFGGDWIEKLKSDLRNVQADAGVIVSQALPKEINGFGEKDGVWICGFNEVRPVVQMLRDGIIKISAALRSQENKGDKMTLLYNYLTSSEFAEQWRAIREGFMSMKISIQKERDAMEKLWKAREKQLEKVLLNATHIRGSIDGISGQDVDLNLLTEGDES
ncbi:MAG TPA: DUF2130 domain-containing protein [Chitinophagaceae bacterium]|jgi:hypothetical protein|nr:DUF2130 domain-containing protein [Chitinophagaceae bacterium]HNA97217.1 DUF2130 domain-containing protein [Chitinophagaceae bacterium]HNC38397.1 DUF2130 domain-containing protein [Chitinophagaceae bacterium]HND95537.1 DUF2130 domain-containing protein [Chitinophagaceae bacterium]HNL60585.1 DUF2130 domain-containing protein [Chitinophagaceae bacterium]